MSLMRKCKLAFLVAAIALLASGCDIFFWRTYYSRESGFLVKAPRSWSMDEGVEGATLVVVAPLSGPEDFFPASINIRVTELPKTVPLSDYYEINRDELEVSLGKLYDLVEGQVLSGFVRGQWLSFSTKIQGVTVRILSCLWIHRQRVYVLTGISRLEKFPEYEAIFRKSMKSLRFR